MRSRSRSGRTRRSNPTRLGMTYADHGRKMRVIGIVDDAASWARLASAKMNNLRIRVKSPSTKPLSKQDEEFILHIYSILKNHELYF